MTQRGFVIWLSGLSGAGKSTLAAGLAECLGRTGQPVEILDGDDVRRHLSNGLGFSREDRDINVLRIGFVARLLARNGVAVIVAAISPYASTREKVRSWFDDFVEVHVACSIGELIRRDTKGLYRRALAGTIEHFTGISDPYEAPEHPDLRVDTEYSTAEDCVSQITAVLERRGLVATGRASAEEGCGATTATTPPSSPSGDDATPVGDGQAFVADLWRPRPLLNQRSTSGA